MDETGRASKPFLLPQEDPEFYDYYIRIYNVPELIREPVRLEQRDVARSLYDPAKAMAAKLDPRVKPPAHPAGPLPEPAGPARPVE